MKVSLVIPAYNEAQYLGKCLDCLVKQTLPRSEFDVLVVDNGSTDGTPELVRQSLANNLLNLRVISRPKVSISGVRNFGAAQTSGDILAFLDADCLPGPEWLSDAVHLAPASGLWGAHYLIPPDATWVGRTWFKYQAKVYVGAVSFLPGGDLFLRRRDFEAVGGFDEAVETSEDVDLAARIRKAGMPVVAMPALAVIHLGTPRTLGRFYRQNRWHGQEVLRLFLKNLPSTKHLPLVSLSVVTFASFWSTLLGLVFACRGHSWYFAVVPFGILLLPPLLIAMQKSKGRSWFSVMAQLFALYLIYFLARAAALRYVTSMAPLLRGRIKT